MIRIRVKGRSGRVEGFMVWGHAQYAPKDRDVVCAGVSALATAAIIGLLRRAPGHIRYRIFQEGLIYCRLCGPLPRAAARDAQAILDTMVLGFEAIWLNYGDCVDLSYRR